MNVLPREGRKDDDAAPCVALRRRLSLRAACGRQGGAVGWESIGGGKTYGRRGEVNEWGEYDWSLPTHRQVQRCAAQKNRGGVV